MSVLMTAPRSPASLLPKAVPSPSQQPPASVPASDKPFVSRRAHTKSRGGCLSCKRRRQKCDEGKPSCSRCQRLEFECEYAQIKPRSMPPSPATSASTEMDIFTPSSAVNEDLIPSLTFLTLSNAATVTSAIGSALNMQGSSMLNTTVEDLNFFITSSFTKAFGSLGMQYKYRIEAIQMGLTRPFLLHSLLALAMMQRRLANTTYTGPLPYETAHWQRGTQLFRARLAKGTTLGDNEALLTTAAFMNGLTFASMLSIDPKEAWPLKDPPDALAWVGMLRGPAILLEPLRKELGDEQFKSSAAGLADRAINNKDICKIGIEGLPKIWVDLCELTPTSTRETNPYLATVQAICFWLPDEQGAVKSAAYFAFIGCVQQQYADLLQIKDHRALLILSYWYALLLSSDFWWCRTRAYVECKAICEYLETRAEQKIVDMLEFPAEACGYQLLSKVNLEEGTLAMAVPDSCSFM